MNQLGCIFLSFVGLPCYIGPSSTSPPTLTQTTKILQVRTKNPTASPPLSEVLKEIVPRIVGGTEVTDPDRYPWHAVKYDDEFLCGGTLIHEDIILSAAHCEVNGPYRERFFLGSISLTEGIQVNVVDGIVHPNYVESPLYFYDAVIYKIDRSVTELPIINLNRNISIPKDGDVLTSLGFGQQNTLTEVTANFAFSLFEVDLNFVDIDTCNAQYFTNSEGAFPEESAVCAGDDAEKAPCFGDSGGPLIDSSDTLVGITAGGFVLDGTLCTTGVGAAFYTNVAGIIDWIDESICTLSSNPPSDCPSLPTFSPTTLSPTTLSPTTLSPTTLSPTSMEPSSSPPTLFTTLSPITPSTAGPTTTLAPTYFRLTKPTKPSVILH